MSPYSIRRNAHTITWGGGGRGSVAVGHFIGGVEGRKVREKKACISRNKQHLVQAAAFSKSRPIYSTVAMQNEYDVLQSTAPVTLHTTMIR